MVDVSMNIKNPETQRLARELAGLTGESLTTAITVAVRERRDRVLAHETAAAMLDLGRDCARRLPPELRHADHGEVLYGPDGMP
jgi:antitoxin VapB